MSSGLVKKVHMIILMEPNLEAAIDFYKQLGVALVFHIKGKWAEMRLDAIKIGLCPTQQVIDGYRTGIVLEVADLHEVYEQYKDRIDFLSEPKQAVHGIMVSFKDPGGNILDLYQPTPEKIAEMVKKTVDADKQGEQNDSGTCCGKRPSCCKRQENGVA